MEPKNQMIVIIDEIISLLEFSKEEFWLSFFYEVKRKYQQKDDAKQVCGSILKAFQGGMGSLNDLVLHKEGKPLIYENNKLDKLKDQLFDYCLEIEKD